MNEMHKMYEKYEQNYTSFEAFFLEKNKGYAIIGCVQ